MRRTLLVLIGLLYLLSVPWYRQADADPDLVFGLPNWVFVAVACYVGVAILNGIAWSLTDVPDVPDELPTIAAQDDS